MSALAPVVGPFFMGVALECLVMGVLLMLSINYFIAVVVREKSPANSSAKLGVTLVAITLTTNSAQTLVDLCRGWQMFAVNFDDLRTFLIPTSLFFVSPFLGLFPALLTQAFMLRRTVLFLSSLNPLWPRLATKMIRYTFTILMAALILLSSIAGIIASYDVWHSRSLYYLAVHGKTKDNFQLFSNIWLSCSSTIDIILSCCLCAELWWARRTLAASRGRMREVVTSLILVTFHGGLSVSVIQIAALILYRAEPITAYCYMPMMMLPKVYSITLVLSCSLPSAAAQAQGSQLSLPTILNSPQVQATGRRSSSPAIVYRGKHEHQTSAKKTSEQKSGQRHSWLPWNIASGLVSFHSRNHSKERHWESRHRFSKHEELGEEPENLLKHPLPTNDDRRPSLPDMLEPLVAARSNSYSHVLPSARLSLPSLPLLPSLHTLNPASEPASTTRSSSVPSMHITSLLNFSDPFATTSTAGERSVRKVTRLTRSTSTPTSPTTLPATHRARPPLRVITSPASSSTASQTNGRLERDSLDESARNRSGRLLSFEDMLDDLQYTPV